jgi:hypothetical protein
MGPVLVFLLGLTTLWTIFYSLCLYNRLYSGTCQV